MYVCWIQNVCQKSPAIFSSLFILWIIRLINVRLRRLCHPKCTMFKGHLILLMPREFQAGLLCRQQIHFEKIDKIVYAQTMHVMLQRVCVYKCDVYKNFVLMRPFIYWVESGEWEWGEWWRLLIDIIYIYVLYKVQIGSEVMVIDIYKKIQFRFNLCINCTQTFKLIRINCVSIIIYCSLFTFFASTFDHTVWKMQQQNIAFFGRVFFALLTWHFFCVCDKDTVWKFCMTTSQLMRVINDVRIINIDNWIVEINKICINK